MSKYGDLQEDPIRREKEIMSFWGSEKIFERSLEETEDEENWIFFEGPPTANGKPHFGHLMARVCKDLYPRYKTMQGYHVGRKGGWDTHGLPVELEVEKDLGLNSKADIEEYGMREFVEKCKESVWEYKEEWEQMIERMGFWIDLDDPYITYENEYIESLWWELKEIWEEDLLYEGHKVLPYCPRCGTGLSSHEVAQGYEEIEDPSIYVKLPLVGEEDVSLLVWTTTPWTIPSNTAVAVSRNFLYAKVAVDGEKLILAKALLDKVLDSSYEIIEEINGEELLGLEYEPPYRMSEDDKAYTAYDAGFVSLEEGTGIVHTAPAFGEEDNELGREKDLPLIKPVDAEGKFTSEFSLSEGEFVKDADEKIMEDLEEKGVMFKTDVYEHEYPFCWRCDTPLIYFALDSWYVKTTERKDEIVANNREINWNPDHMREGRFGGFLSDLKDWALSRDRFWGTPLNIWECENCGNRTCVGSRDELEDLALDPDSAKDVELHRPFIDKVKLECSECGEEMERVPYVIDTWFDSGSMHTAQWHYPFENEDKFESNFPGDFISEGQDQTRGWFYTLLVTSTLLYDEPAFKNVVVTGYGLDSEGRAMSKSRGNVIDPWDLIEDYGADAIRWYLFSSTAPWKTRRLKEDGPAEILYKFFNTIENTYNFFSMYANIDDFTPAEAGEADYSVLDRWILSRLNGTISNVTEALDDYDIVGATRKIENFVDDLSNWYVRCSRERFWSSGSSENKLGAYETLYRSLVDLTKLLAPFVPFLAEEVYLNLVPEGRDSVHLCDWPEYDESQVDETLQKHMETVRELTATGRRLRDRVDIKVRQPLPKLIVKEDYLDEEFDEDILDLLKEELNVKGLEVAENFDDYMVPVVDPDFSKIGPGFGELAQQVGERLKEASGEEVIRQLSEEGTYKLQLEGKDEEVEVREEHLEISARPEEGLVQSGEEESRVLLDTRIDESLREEGYVRELVRRVQQLRKEADFDVTDRIELYCVSEKEIRKAVRNHSDYISSETLAERLVLDELPGDPDISSKEEVNGFEVRVGLVREE